MLLYCEASKQFCGLYLFVSFFIIGVIGDFKFYLNKVQKVKKTYYVKGQNKSKQQKLEQVIL